MSGHARNRKGFNQKRGQADSTESYYETSHREQYQQYAHAHSHGQHDYHDYSEHNNHHNGHSEYHNGHNHHQRQHSHHGHYQQQQQQHTNKHQQNRKQKHAHDEYNPYIHSNGIMSNEQLHHVQNEMHTASQHHANNPYVGHQLTSAMSHYSPTKNAQFVHYYAHQQQQQQQQHHNGNHHHRHQHQAQQQHEPAHGYNPYIDDPNVMSNQQLAELRHEEDARYANGHHHHSSNGHTHAHAHDDNYSSLVHRIENNFTLQVDAAKQRKIETIREKNKAKQQRAQQRSAAAAAAHDQNDMMNSMGAIVESEDDDLNLDAVHNEYEQFLSTVQPTAHAHNEEEDDEAAEQQYSMASPVRSESNASSRSSDGKEHGHSHAYREVRRQQEMDSNVNIHDMDGSGQPRITPRNAKEMLRVNDNVWMMDREMNAWTVYTVIHVDCMQGADENDNEHILFTLQYGAKKIKMWSVQFATSKVFKMVGAGDKGDDKDDDGGGGGVDGDGDGVSYVLQYVPNDIIRCTKENVMYRIQTFDAKTFDAEILRLSNSQIQKVNLKEFAHTKWS
mmetsp:Transcript_6834/g.10784  ORF Transcript_6834/g.10784 Transcript_6834/m.10784 type:complete len:559 (-) Transcript_6834:251-1927(-)